MVSEVQVTNEIYQRWLDFSQRMAFHGFPKATEKRRQRLRNEVTAFISLYEHEEATCWDDKPYPCDHFYEYFDEYNHHRWDKFGGDIPLGSFLNQLACCIRAGLDVAAEPSAGVVGWTVGDIRRMYDGTIPEWIKRAYPDADFDVIKDEEDIWL